MSNVLVAFLFSIGFAAWVYAKTMRTSGNNTKNSLTVAGIAGAVAFLLIVSVISLF